MLGNGRRLLALLGLNASSAEEAGQVAPSPAQLAIARRLAGSGLPAGRPQHQARAVRADGGARASGASLGRGRLL
jgi:hypothetical protein